MLHRCYRAAGIVLLIAPFSFTTVVENSEHGFNVEPEDDIGDHDKLPLLARGAPVAMPREFLITDQLPSKATDRLEGRLPFCDSIRDSICPGCFLAVCYSH